MSTSNVSLLSDFSERCLKGLEYARALVRGDPGHSNLLDHLAAAIERTEADRVAVLWLHECGLASKTRVFTGVEIDLKWAP